MPADWAVAILSRVALSLASSVSGRCVFLNAHYTAGLESGFFSSRASAKLLAFGDAKALQFAGRLDGCHASAGVSAFSMA